PSGDGVYDHLGNLIVVQDVQELDYEGEGNASKRAGATSSSATAAIAAANANSVVNGSGGNVEHIGPPSSMISLSTSSFTDLTFELLKFRILKGHCRVPVKRGGVLGKWVDRLRKEYKKMKELTSATAMAAAIAGTTTTTTTTPENVRLDAERISVLSHLGMMWEFPNEDFEEIWQTHLQQLMEFKEKNG
ncbi:MAG: hypothetical protein SGARI_006205, partial [Bacillariaceae sp.]